jgi:SAM-dependent methyltransferase
MDLISPKDLIARLGIDGLNATADDYYKKIPDLSGLQAKPFTNFDESPVLLYNLGLILGGLNLAPGMTVMDFGCGVGWLGRILIQMNCNVIFLDVSQTALASAEIMLREQVPAKSSPFSRRADFSLFDGRKLDLPDSSVDRIISFAAFHHTANPDEILAEFHRVLKVGGIVGFYEPGVGHSQSGGSQHEMREFAALENDIPLRELINKAENLGFSESRFHFSTHPSITLSKQEFFCLHDEKHLPPAVVEATANHSRASYVFFLFKGRLQYDSRQAKELRAAISLLHEPVLIPLEREVQLKIRVMNIGKARWLSNAAGGIGVVKVGVHLSANDGTYSNNDFARGLLQADMNTGEESVVALNLIIPFSGKFTVTLDMVSEQVAWFETLGSQPVSFQISV